MRALSDDDVFSFSLEKTVQQIQSRVADFDLSV